MKKFFILIISIALFSFSVFGANVGDEIKNRAFVSYSIGGVDKNQTTNEVVTTITNTPAIIEFYSYYPSNNDTNKTNKLEDDNNQIVEPTYYFNEDGKPILVDKAQLPSGEIIQTRKE